MLRDLHELQRQLQNYLLGQQPHITSAIVGTVNMPVTSRLQIYRDAYYLRLLEALQQDYPTLHALMGEEQFDQLGRHYIDSYPSHYRSIRWFGKDMALFLQHTQSNDDQPWQSEMAKFEWLLGQAFDAEDKTVITINAMAAIPAENWPGVSFKLHPSFCRFDLSWDIVSVWKALKETGIATPPKQVASIVCWMIWRKGYDIHFSSLTADEAYMVESMAMGATFATICEGLCQWLEEEVVAGHAALLLKRFITDQLIMEIC